MRMVDISADFLSVGEAFDGDGDLPLECAGGHGDVTDVYLGKEQAMALAMHIVELYSLTDGEHSDAMRDAGMSLSQLWADLNKGST